MGPTAMPPLTESNESQRDQEWMALALEAAQTAAGMGEVPVGAVLIGAGGVLAVAGNAPIARNDPTAHAEILALRAGAELLANYRLPGTTLYVTLEPCLMCIGAIIHARVERLVYGATDPKSGAVRSLYAIGDDPRLNHRLQITAGILEQQCSDLLRSFFQKKRAAAAALPRSTR